MVSIFLAYINLRGYINCDLNILIPLVRVDASLMSETLRSVCLALFLVAVTGLLAGFVYTLFS